MLYTGTSRTFTVSSLAPPMLRQDGVERTGISTDVLGIFNDYVIVDSTKHIAENATQFAPNFRSGQLARSGRLIFTRPII